MKDQNTNDLNELFDDLYRANEIINKFLIENGKDPVDFMPEIKAKPLFDIEEIES